VATAAVIMASQQKAVAAALAASNKNKELLDKSVIVSSAGNMHTNLLKSLTMKVFLFFVTEWSMMLLK
jgi:hypothetical protein